MMGATMTAVGMPASAEGRTASSLRMGVAARGSIRRARWRSSVVIEMATLASPSFAMTQRMSISRVTSADLVTMATGWRASFSTSSNDRVMRRSRSIG